MQILNKKARLNYKILETLEAGIALEGHEVKSIRSGGVSLTGAHVQIGVGSGTIEARLVGMHAAPYLPAGQRPDIARHRSPKLLLHKHQILNLYQKSRARNLTLIPLRIYSHKSWIKVEVGLARGRKKWEKRADLKKRAAAREMGRYQ